MGESRKHIELGEIAFNYTKTIVPEYYLDLIEVDCCDQKKPSRVIGNYVPDVFYCFNNLMVIGEAKTLDDFERRHSKEQFMSYIKECSLFDGDAYLIVSVPWEIVVTAKTYFKKLTKDSEKKITIVVLNETGKDFKI